MRHFCGIFKLFETVVYFVWQVFFHLMRDHKTYNRMKACVLSFFLKAAEQKSATTINAGWDEYNDQTKRRQSRKTGYECIILSLHSIWKHLKKSHFVTLRLILAILKNRDGFIFGMKIQMRHFWWNSNIVSQWNVSVRVALIW